MIRPATAKWWLIWPGSSSSMEWPHDVCMRGLCNSSQGPRILDYKNHGSLCSSPSLVTRHILRTQRTHLSVVMSSSVTPRLRWWCGRYRQSIDTHCSMWCVFELWIVWIATHSMQVHFRSDLAFQTFIVWLWSFDDDPAIKSFYWTDGSCIIISGVWPFRTWSHTAKQQWYAHCLHWPASHQLRGRDDWENSSFIILSQNLSFLS